MKRSRSLSVVIVLSLLCLQTASRAEDVAAEAKDLEKTKHRVEALQKEKVAILENLVRQLEKDHSDGLVRMSKVLNTKDRLLKAKLVLATDKAERKAILTERVALFRSLERITMRDYRAGEKTVSPSKVTEAKLRRLDAEIALAKE